jgi:hypothetical protein
LYAFHKGYVYYVSEVCLKTVYIAQQCAHPPTEDWMLWSSAL